MRSIILTSCFVLAAGNALATESTGSGTSELAEDAAKLDAIAAEVEAKDAAAEEEEAKDKKEKKAETKDAAEGTEGEVSAPAPETTPAAEPPSATEAMATEPAASPETPPSEPAVTEPIPPATEAATTTEAPAGSTPSVAATVTPAEPSTGIERSGIYFGFGLGAGAGNLSDETLAGPSSGMLLIRGGISFGSQVQVGTSLALLGQWNTWSENEHSGSAMSSLLVEATYYPLASVPWGVSGGAGWGSAMRVDRLVDKNKDSPRVLAESGNGISFMGATSYDLTSGPGANFGLQLRYDGASLGDLGLVSVGTLGLWLNWY